MTDEPHAFDEQGARRIVGAVRAVERAKLDAGNLKVSSCVRDTRSVLVRIIGEATDGLLPGKYVSQGEDVTAFATRYQDITEETQDCWLATCDAYAVEDDVYSALVIGTHDDLALCVSNDSANAHGLLSPLTTKGDIWVRNATVDTRLPVGTDSYLLSANSAQSTGLQYIAPSSLGFGDVFSTSSTSVDNNIVRMDGAFGHTIQKSSAFINDSGMIYTDEKIRSEFLAGGGNTFYAQLNYLCIGGFRSGPGIQGSSFTGSNGASGGFCFVPYNENSDGHCLWMAQISSPLVAGVSTPKSTYIIAPDGFGIGYLLASGAQSITYGATGTLGPGAVATGGVITNIGSGSFVSTSGTNTFTAANVFHPSTDVVPLTVQGSASQTANLFNAKNNAGTVLASISASGVITGAGISGPAVNFTLDCGTW